MTEGIAVIDNYDHRELYYGVAMVTPLGTNTAQQHYS